MSDTAYKALIETEIFESLESLKNPIRTIAQDEPITLIEPNLGKFFQLSKIETTSGEEVYIRSCFLAPDIAAGNTSAPPKQLIGEDLEPPVPNPIKIKDAKIGTPYMEGGSVNIVMDSRFTDTQEVLDNITDLKLTAITTIFEYYGKVATETQLNEFALNPFNLIKMHDPYFPTRPCKGIMVKFSVRKKYFNAFKNMSFDDFRVDNIHKNFISTSFEAKNFEKSILSLINVLEKYGSDVGKFKGSLVGIDFNKTAHDMRNFLSNFKKFLSNNNVSLENAGNSKFEIGFNRDNFKIEYMLHFNPYGNFLIIGL